MLELLRAEGVTVLNQTPPAFGPLAEEATLQTPPLALRLIVFGGQRLDPVKLRAVASRIPCRETRQHVRNHRDLRPRHLSRDHGSRHGADLQPVGRAIPTLRTYIVDPRCGPCRAA